MADTPELGRALAEFAAACSRLAEPSTAPASAAPPDVEDAVPAFLGRAGKADQARPPIRVNGNRPPAEPAPPSVPPPSEPERTPAPAAVPASRAPTAAPQGEETLMDLERRLGLRGPEE